MSHTQIAPAPARLNRSELAVPGSSPRFFEKAAAGPADIVFLDLEDAVAPDRKAEARKNVIQAIGDCDWGDKALSVRINGLDTPYMYRDIVDLLENCAERLDLIMIPKLGTAADVYTVDALVTQVEMAMGRKKRLGFELIVETALGMQNITGIAAASPRNESLHFGAADYAASTRMRTVQIGGANPDYGVLTDPRRERPARFSLGRYVALRDHAHGRRRARPTGSGHATGRSAISPTPRPSPPMPNARLYWDATANGRSIRARSAWPTTSSRRRPGRSRRRGRSSPP